MAKAAFIVGGSGQIGQAAARRLLADGWRLRLGQRTGALLPAELRAEVETVSLDRDQPGALASALAGGADALIDCVAFDERHAAQLLEVSDDVGRLVVISSGSVYRDAEGRTLDEARETGFPRFPEPITEDQPTVAPGPATYSTRKAALERALLEGARTPLAILRPFAIHGPGATHVREWWFVRRIRDGRRRIPLAYGGESRFHTTATVNLAELIATVLAAPGAHLLNIADPVAPSVAEIGRTISELYGADPELVPIAGPAPNGVGGTPWSGPLPIVASNAAAEALGYRPVASYAEAVPAACRSAEAFADAGVRFLPYIEAMFDYAAEDRYFEGRA